MRKVIVIALFLAAFAAKAQDPFVTQRFNTPLFVNPALTGNGEKLNRLSFLYRDQWRSVPVPYVSTFLNYDRKLLEKKDNRLGGGIMFFYDKAGDGSLSTFHPSLLLSYTRFFNEQKQSVSVGVRVGYLQRTLDQSKLTYDNQYGPGGFDPDLGTGENFGGSASIPDLGTGINFQTRMGDLSSWNIGFAVYDPHQPEIGFSPETPDPRPVRFTTYLTADLFVNPEWSLTPSFHFQGQEKAKEFHSSLYFTNHTRIKDTPFEWSLGAGYRNNDAAFAYTGFAARDVHLGFSYDINTSAFADATNNKGGFEITLRYEFERRKELYIDSNLVDTLDTLIEVDSLVEEVVPDTLVETTETVVVVTEPEVQPPVAPAVREEIAAIEKLLPIRLFFANDQPDPGSNSKHTQQDYTSVYERYAAQRPAFENNIGREEADAWFGEIAQGRQLLYFVALQLESLAADGQRVRLNLKGYTSPLAMSPYNVKLSMRRIESVKNYLLRHNSGVLRPYIADGTIVIEENPYGETYAPADVSDDPKNKKASVYSRSASFERRVEVVGIELIE